MGQKQIDMSVALGFNQKKNKSVVDGRGLSGVKQKHHEFIALAFWLRKIKQINPELLWPFGFPKIISKQ